VWAGISWNGPTPIIILEGKMDAIGYVEILQKGLKPFLDHTIPHRFMQDNDPKHTSRLAGKWITDHNINWWKTPPESPDINPIENLWHELKEFLRREVKPTTKDELINGIKYFWQTVDDFKCQKYIKHLRKVVPTIIELKGEAILIVYSIHTLHVNYV
jgi:transposase